MARICCSRSRWNDQGEQLSVPHLRCDLLLTTLTPLCKVFDEVDIKAIKELASKRGEDGEKLLNSTYEGKHSRLLRSLLAFYESRELTLTILLSRYTEIKQILSKKSEEAKKLAEKSAAEAKDAKK